MKYSKRLLAMFVAFLVMLTSFYFMNTYTKNNQRVDLQIDVMMDQPSVLQLFAASSPTSWDEKQSVTEPYTSPRKWETMVLEVPHGGNYIRIDPGSSPGEISFRNAVLQGNGTVALPLDKLNAQYHELAAGSAGADGNSWISTGNDPYFYFDSTAFIEKAREGVQAAGLLTDILVAIASGLLFYLLVKYSKDTIIYARELIANRRLVLSLAKNDFKTKYASSYLGVLWGFIHPLLTIATYWFVFQVGLRNGNVAGVPFIIWFIAGIIPWFFFSEAISSGTNAFYEYSYLVKKVVFKIQLLPAVKIFSAFFVQLFFTVFIFIVYGAYGYPPTLLSLQLIYYLFAMLVLVVALTLITSSIVLFFKDLNQIITVVLQIGFWFTPIGWPVSMLSGGWAVLFKLNPMFYIVQGYRDTLVDHVLFYERPYQTLFFWIFCLAALAFGTKLFKRLKPHFADVL